MMLESQLVRSVVGLATVLVVLLVALPAAVVGSPQIKLDENPSEWYYRIQHSVYAGVKDDQEVADVHLLYRHSAREAFTEAQMEPFPDPVVQDNYTFYQTAIPAADVRDGLEFKVTAINAAGESVESGVTKPVLRVPIYDVFPALNAFDYDPDVRLLRKVPKQLFGLTGGGDTSFEYSVPGHLWVPVELSDFGLYALIDSLPGSLDDRDARREVYSEVLYHLFIQDGLANSPERHLKAQQNLVGMVQDAVSSFGLAAEVGQVLIDSLGTTIRLNETGMRAVYEFLRAVGQAPQWHYTGMQLKYAEFMHEVQLLSLLADAASLSSDFLKALWYVVLSFVEAAERAELFGETYMQSDDVDPALRDAFNRVLSDISSLEGKFVLAFKATFTASDVFNLVNIGKALASLSGMLQLSSLASLSLGCVIQAGQLAWEDIFVESDWLRVLILSATLEKTLNANALTKAPTMSDLNRLRQMKYYLGYYYSTVFLRLESKYTIAIANLISSIPGLGWGSTLATSFDRMRSVQEYCAEQYAEYVPLAEPSSSMPEGSLTLQEAADQGLIELESKGGYAGDAVTLIATGENEDEVTVVSRPGDVLLVKGEQGVKQSLVISKHDVTVILAGTPAGTVLKRGLYTFCIDAEGSGLHEYDRFDVTLNLEDWPYESAQQLLMLLNAIAQAGRYEDSAAQHAVWVITNNDSPDPESQALLRQAGIISAPSLRVFPALLTNPASGSPNTTFVMPPELRGCSLFVVTLICSLLVLLLTLAGAIVVAHCR
jgi:hypothetical protein